MSAGRPSLLLLGTEPLRASWEALRHLAGGRGSGRRGNGRHTVVLFPGLAGDARSLWALKRHLERRGLRVIDWGQGFNTGPRGDVERWLAGLTRQVLARAGVARGDRISLVGWSLGGLYAREIARQVPSAVRRVVTIGTPFNAGPDDTHAGWLFKLLSGQPPAPPRLRKRLATPPPVATTSIYSRHDGVVAWQACLHLERPAHVREIEVPSSHLGMGWNRAVLDQVACELMRPAPRAASLAAVQGTAAAKLNPCGRSSPARSPSTTPASRPPSGVRSRT
jgi:pimeloyl-ACP methyl ester carboxylesterase